jgi:uncharacterized protein DUF3300
MKRLLFAALFLLSLTSPMWAQGAPLPPPPQEGAVGAPLPAPPQVAQSYAPQELDRIVSPIALYPDPLLAQILTAATFSPQIPEAARWADQHHYVSPAQLPAAMAADQVPWEPSVQALMPFPSVLGMMASDMPWTDEIGAAFLESPTQVMDAVQRMRQQAYDYGYLRSTPQVVVRNGPFIEIEPVDPAFVVVPYYAPAVVFAPPRPGFVAAGAIRFGYGIRLGVTFAPWGWGSTRFVWGQRTLIVNNAPWRRTWTNRTVYVHPFTAVPRRVVVARAPAPEHHAVQARSEREREAERNGHKRVEEHKREEHKHEDHK